MVSRKAARTWAIAVCVVAALAGCTTPRATFVTEHGLGPDKWATAWLLTTSVAPGAELSVVDTGTALPPGIAFDVPGSDIVRKGRLSAFEGAVAKHGLGEPHIARLARIVHDIEIGPWGTAADPESPKVEAAFRTLQQRYGRDEVLPACYLRFFSAVDEAIRASPAPNGALDSALLDINCEQVAKKPGAGQIVAEVPTGFLLAEMARGRRVVFVDVREQDEFQEAHIPGALNFPIRDLDSALDHVRDADYVVSYCIKDFRGFEMAKALKMAGIKNSVILKPYGIRGWVEQGLPTVGQRAMSEAAGRNRLTRCSEMPSQCRADKARVARG